MVTKWNFTSKSQFMRVDPLAKSKATQKTGRQKGGRKKRDERAGPLISFLVTHQFV